MKKTILKLSLIMFIFISCKNDDSNNNPNPLNGKWFIDRIDCFCEYNNNSFTEEYILWEINTENNTLKVINYFSDESVFLATGQYNFTLTEDSININDSDSILNYEYKFENEKLILSNHPELDGELITFIVKETNCTTDPFEDYQWLSDIKFNYEANQNPIGNKIVQYIYNDECVYLTGTETCCDQLIEVYNTQGEVICKFGGIAGFNTCPDFYDSVTDKRVLYNDIQD